MIEGIFLLFSVTLAWFGGSAVVRWSESADGSADKKQWRQLTNVLVVAALVAAAGAWLA